MLYKDARVDMNILDETIGSDFWQRDHKELKGNLYAGLGIWNEGIGQWVWKWDCGTESNTEKEKGEASDSFKRACTNLGIGRELYTSPFIFIECETYEFPKESNKYKMKNQYEFSKARVTSITYEEDAAKRVVSGLTIKNGAVVIFQMGKESVKKTEEKTKEKTEAEIDKEEVEKLEQELIDAIEAEALQKLAKNAGATESDVLKYYEVESFGCMTKKTAKNCRYMLEEKKRLKEQKQRKSQLA